MEQSSLSKKAKNAMAAKQRKMKQGGVLKARMEAEKAAKEAAAAAAAAAEAAALEVDLHQTYDDDDDDDGGDDDDDDEPDLAELMRELHGNK